MEPRPTVLTHIYVLITLKENRVSRHRISLKHVITHWRKAHNAPALASFIFCLISTVCSGTQIIILKGDRFIVIAADSKYTIPNALAKYGCKVFQTKNVFWTSSGLATDSSTGFDLRTYFRPEAIKSNIALGETLDRIGKRILPALQPELAIIKTRAPETYAAFIRQDGNVIGIFAGRVTPGKTEAYVKEFKIRNDRIVAFPSHTCDVPTGSYGCVIVSERPAVMAYIIAHPDVWEDSRVNMMDRLMNAAAANSDDVGPPYSIIEVRKDGAYWLRKNDCAEVSAWPKKTVQDKKIRSSLHKNQ